MLKDGKVPYDRPDRTRSTQESRRSRRKITAVLRQRGNLDGKGETDTQVHVGAWMLSFSMARIFRTVTVVFESEHDKFLGSYLVFAESLALIGSSAEKATSR